METIKSWATVICITLILTTIFSMLVPKGSMEKIIQFTISMFFIVSFITPFLTKLPSLSLDVEAAATPQTRETQSLEDSMKQKLLELTASNLEVKANGFLEEIWVQAEKIAVLINNETDDRITISKITVWLDKSYRDQASRIEAKLKEEMMTQPELCFTEE